MQTNTAIAKDIDANSIPTIEENINYKKLNYDEDIDALPQSTKPLKTKLRLIRNIPRPTQIKGRDLEWWIGSVTEVHKDYFTGRLEDLAGNVNIVTFDMDELNSYEKSMAFEGSTFTYSVSFVDNPAGISSGRTYKTKLAFSSRKKWLNEYESASKKLIEDTFPLDLLENE